MSFSTTKRREFPALFMTALFIGASLASTGCLRTMTDQPMPQRWSDTGALEYYAPNDYFTPIDNVLETQANAELTSNKRLTIHN